MIRVFAVRCRGLAARMRGLVRVILANVERQLGVDCPVLLAELVHPLRGPCNLLSTRFSPTVHSQGDHPACFGWEIRRAPSRQVGSVTVAPLGEAMDSASVGGRILHTGGPRVPQRVHDIPQVLHLCQHRRFVPFVR